MTEPEDDFDDTDDEDEDEDEDEGDELDGRAGEFLRKAHKRSAFRVFGERARLAKGRNRLIDFMDATFHQIHTANDLLEPRTAQQRAIEVLPLLESEEHARQFQNDFNENAYGYYVSWMTACVYELLSEATGQSEGYNSEGMQACLSDGIQVCRRTGKLGCIGCFREFATEVYRSSDDLSMAMHYARSVQVERDQYPTRGDCRYIGARDETWIQLLQGRLEDACDTIDKATRLCQASTVVLPWSSRMGNIVGLERQCDILSGSAGEMWLPTIEEDGADEVFSKEKRPVPRDEHRVFDLRWDQGDALLACCQGDYEQAKLILSRWDRWLTEHHGLHHWFEVRLRLIACHRLAGTTDKIDALAKQLDEKAWKARDWLTLHRMARLLDSTVKPTPLALLGPLDSGPFADVRTSVSVPATPAPVETEAASQPQPSAEAVPQAPPEAETIPLEATFQQFVQRIESLQDDAGRHALRNDLLAIPASDITHPVDAARLMHLLSYLVSKDDPTASHLAVWTWADAVSAPFPQVSVVLNLRAALAETLRERDDPALAERIPDERIEQLFRESVRIDPFHPRNHFRAGVYYLTKENLGEAEHCLARGCRLERNFGPLALKLAEVYQRTERPRDALMVLDTCLREGCEDPAVAWEASLNALNLNQYEPLLTYLDRHEQLQPGAPWVNYYRAVALLELARPQEALAAVEAEARRSPACHLAHNILRACADQMLDHPDEVRRHLANVLAGRLVEVDYLTFRGLCNLFGRLWSTVGGKLPTDEPLRAALEQRLLATGLAPDELFEPIRQRAEVSEDVRLYHCVLRQPLDENWPASEGCLHSQESWDYYMTVWGVLARDPDEAWSLVEPWQARCATLPPERVDCQDQEELYKDRPGVVFQGQRWRPEE